MTAIIDNDSVSFYQFNSFATLFILILHRPSCTATIKKKVSKHYLGGGSRKIFQELNARIGLPPPLKNQKITARRFTCSAPTLRKNFGLGAVLFCCIAIILVNLGISGVHSNWDIIIAYIGPVVNFVLGRIIVGYSL